MQVKERELKVLKFKSLFETPAREKRSGTIAAHSARAGLGRSITKTSDELKKMTLLDPKPSRNGKHVGVNESFNRLQDNGPLYNSAMLGEGGLEALPRRKTVGFRDTSMHRKLTISEAGNCGDNTTVVVVDDLDDCEQS